MKEGGGRVEPGGRDGDEGDLWRRRRAVSSCSKTDLELCVTSGDEDDMELD